jgi:dipeptidyl aminopeptidase/acylaminoacyl peptidase
MLTQIRTAVLAVLTIVAAPSGRPTTDLLHAQRVAVVGGDVYFVEAPGATARRMTSAGLDTEVALSSDGQTIAFVRRTPGLLVNTVSGPDEATEFWVMRVDATAGRMLVRGRTGTTPEATLASFKRLQFSPDGRRVYFLSPAWVTSSAVHVAAVESGRTRFVCPGNTLEVIPRGEYAGYLMVTQHRYFLAGGSYDWLWLVHPDGQAVGPIADVGGSSGDRLELFRAMYIDAAPRKGASLRPP